jgi:pimeloyl-ACP methyl ester carboxylesterase
MPRAKSNGLELEYETFGDRSHPDLVLVMGLGAQMIAWDAGFCRALADEGFHVIRFDNRDLRAVLAGDRTAVPYLLGDMADDIVGLLDTLGIAKAHVVGASMGGMIAQQLAIDHPDRLLSLCSIMSTTGDPTVGQSTPEALATLIRPPAASREQALAQGVAAYRVLGSPGFPVDDEQLLAKVGTNYDRAYHPAGSQRQAAAILASPDRTEGLRGVTLPTLVIHGDADPLVDPSGGKATAAAVPCADLLLIPGMGHDLPSGAWPAIVAAIARNTRR